jgi:antitoxin (DNA-binding transcriptional repressor) of toxin-antitoxin stability system
LTATEGARRLSELLDAIEERGESFLVVRRGRTIARIAPAAAANGNTVERILRSTPPDRVWLDELRELRAGLAVGDSSWNG